MIFNAGYSPEYMPIEFVFSVVKRRFKQLKTNAILNKEQEKTVTLIKKAFAAVRIETVRNSI